MLRPLCSRCVPSSALSASSRLLANRSFSTARVAYHHISSSQSPKRPTFQPSHPSILHAQRRYYAEVTIEVPEMAESISEGTLKQWAKKVGDHVEQDEEIATIETDKIDVSVNAPAAGTITELLVNEEDTVSVHQSIAKMDDSGAPAEGGDKSKKAESEPKEAATEEQKTSSQPEGGKEKSQEEPKPDKKEQPQTPPKPKEPEPPKQEDKPKPKPAEKDKAQEPPASKESKEFGGREERRVKMNRMRLRIAERLKQSQNTAASLTTFQKVDMSALMEFRRKYKDEILKKTGIKIGFMSAFTKASVLAMKDIPSVNASIEGPNGGDTIVYRDYVDVSVAVATEKGLVTPVVRNAESMELVDIEKSIADLGKKARDNKLTIEDMAGGTYTISNGGVFGSLFGTPIINLPQTAVLGLHAINDEATVVNGKIEIRPIMYLALTYDHRLLDGREAVTFLKTVKGFIEDPAKMLLG